MNKQIRVLVVDDHPVVREGIVALLTLTPGIVVAGEGSNGKDAVYLAGSVTPDVVLLDLMMPGIRGPELVSTLLAHHPAIRILILTGSLESRLVSRAIIAGALGCIPKDCSLEELERAIQTVYSGKSYLYPSIARKLIQEFNSPIPEPRWQDALTESEMETLKLVAKGYSNAEIAARTGASLSTVGNNVLRIFKKLHLDNRTQAALFALREGLVGLNEIDLIG